MVGLERLCGVIGWRVRLLIERLVVQAHPGTIFQFNFEITQFCAPLIYASEDLHIKVNYLTRGRVPYL